MLDRNRVEATQKLGRFTWRYPDRHCYSDCRARLSPRTLHFSVDTLHSAVRTFLPAARERLGHYLDCTAWKHYSKIRQINIDTRIIMIFIYV